MAFVPLKNRLPNLPLILAGPVLRRTVPAGVSVWIALKAPRTVTLRVYSRQGSSRVVRALGTTVTRPFGTDLHVAVVTAEPIQSPSPIAPGEVFVYNLFFASAAGDVPESGDNLNTSGILNSATSGHTPVELNYPGLSLPGFALAPGVSQLRLLHASCRKPHGEMRDALPFVDGLIQAAAEDPARRPHVFCLTGDQIYADDVADALLFMLTDAGSTLLGDWFETLPGDWSRIGRSTPPTVKDLAPGTRTLAIDKVARLTAGGVSKSHLMGLSEFFAMYLFAWSNVMWPPDFPTFEEVFPDRDVPTDVEVIRGEYFKEELKGLRNFRSRLRFARRVLANVPTYMIFDDHEVTDDWYLTREWANAVLGNECGKRIIRNALAGFALFQAWGNEPTSFTSSNGQALLQNLSKWCASKGTDDAAGSALDANLGVPPPPGTADRLAKTPAAVTWHHVVPGVGFNILFLDTRTFRGFPGTGNRDIVELMTKEAFEAQFGALRPLSQPEQVAIVITPAPLVGHPAPEFLQEVLGGTRFGKNVDAEHWGGQPLAFERMLAKLSQTSAAPAAGDRRARVVVLSGDVHYGYAVHIRFQATQVFEGPGPAPVEAAIAQLTASALKNESELTRRLHNHLSKPGVLEPVRRYGWDNPRGGVRTVGQVLAKGEQAPVSVRWHVSGQPAIEDFDTIVAIEQITEQPDWRYRMSFVESQEDRLDRVDFTPRVVNPPPRGDREAALRAYLDAGFNHDVYRKWLQSGKRLVGTNNFGEVTFSWGPNENKFVTQELWFWLADKTEPFPLMRAQVPLSLATPKPPI